MSFTEKTAFIKKKKKKKKSLPTLPNFFGVITLNTYIFLFGPTKHEKHFEKMAELTYAEVTQGRESTRLPHTHNFTSLKNVVISALHKIDNEYIFKPKCNCRRKGVQEKEPIMVV